MPETIVIPSLRGTLRHALPHVVEGKVIPTVLFVGCLQFIGATAAILVALGWSLFAVCRRLYRKKKLPGLLILTTLSLTIKTIAALATGSLFIYFLQPTAATALTGLAFLVSVPLGKPLVERLAHDVMPFDEVTRNHPRLRQFFSRVSLWWAAASMVNFSITLWLLLTQSPTTFVVVKSFLGPATTACTGIVAAVWFRAHMAHSGTLVVYERRSAAAAI